MIDPVKISSMRLGGKKLAAVRDQVTAAVKPGVNLKRLDDLADKLLHETGGEPAFKKVPGYDWATCINLNAGIVHGIPHAHTIIQDGDIVSIDVGLWYQGYYTDTSTTVIAGNGSKQQQQFLAAGRAALKTAINLARPHNRIGHISRAIQSSVEAAGYNCLRNYTGHGVGKELHEFPSIPCVLNGPIESTPPLEPGMTLAIEVMYMAGSPEVIKLKDGWTIAIKDNSISCLFEETILIGKKTPHILTASLP